MQENSASTLDGNTLNCSSLLKKSQEYANEISYHKVTIQTTVRQIREQLDRVEELLACLKQAQKYLPPSTYQTRYSDIISRRTIYVTVRLTDIEEILSKQTVPHTEEELVEKENLYLQIISLFNGLENREHAANALTKLCIMFKHFLTDHHPFNNKERMAQLYKYTCDAIKMYSTHNPPPTELPITDIFEMFARVIHHEDPRLARDVLLSALDHNKNGYCHNKNAIFLCLKGLAANYMKLIDRRYGHINDENADQEIDACYQLAINYFRKALEFQKTHALESVDNNYCFLMLSTANIRLAAHYQLLYSKLGHAELLAHIEHWFREAIHWAHVAHDKRKVGIGYNQLAHHFYSQGKMNEAIDNWRLAIDNLIQDLEMHPAAPFQLATMKTAYQQNTHTLHPDDPRYINFCSQLTKDLINLGNELKALEMHRFYRTSPSHTLSVSEDHNLQSSLSFTAMKGRK